MQARLTAGRWTMRVGSSTNRIWKHEQRRPVNEEVEMEINRGKEKKEKKREEIGKTVESQFLTQPPPRV
ncbi:hypothetical protein PVL29_011088 [Vitis rotundifolia]|uniref:Uncharacterized protein n=1 Tax=Vitis rotundifolia TaxID=103349 RepID=A0AA38ZMG2_VITRO|nr:hypothetical protein PVL29_011088 [Vitis rotundifolia]